MNASRFCHTVVLCFLLLLILGINGNLLGKAFPCRFHGADESFSGHSWEEVPVSQGKLYILRVKPGSPLFLKVGMSASLATVESPQWKPLSGGAQPIFIINGGFFDPSNAKTTSFLYQDGVKTGDPHDNRKLVENPRIQPYLERIFNRTEFRVYECNKSVKNPEGRYDGARYDIVPHDAPVPNDCSLRDALGAGPRLLPTVDAQAEGFIDYDAAGKLIRDPIGVFARNARSVIGLTADNEVIVIMGAQDPAAGKTGFNLQDMARELEARGAVKAMALDGGSSSGVVYRDKAIYGKANQDGTPIIRPVKSVLMLLSP